MSRSIYKHRSRYIINGAIDLMLLSIYKCRGQFINVTVDIRNVAVDIKYYKYHGRYINIAVDL